MPSLGSTLLKVLLIIIIVVAVIIVVLFALRFLPSPATITPSTTTIDLGQSVSMGVSWKGGSAPYTIILYSSSGKGCTSSSTVLGTKSGQPLPQSVFTISPTSTARYCATVSSSSGSSTVSSSVVVTVNPALGVPALSLSPSAIDSGQSATVTATVTVTGGTAPYEVTLYSGTSDSCAADTAVVSVSSGSNPITGLVGTIARFSFAGPAVDTFYCATVLNSVSSTPVTSSTSTFGINPALTASISPGTPKLDSGQSITLSAVVSQGTPPYSYQWYSGLVCATSVAGQNSSSFSTGALTSNGTYSVLVKDSSTGTPAANLCAKVTVAVSSAFMGTAVTIGPSLLIDDGQAISLTVSWGAAGTLPYTVKLTTSSSSGCSKPTPSGLNKTGLTTTSAVFNLSPSSTAFYCATVSDGATSPESASTTSAAAITVNPALAPSVVLSPPAIDSGQTATLTATVVLSGGTSPYTVTLHSGSSSSCSSDTVVVVSTGPNPQTDVTSPTATLSTPAPSSSTYYCATVTDSAPVPVTATSPPAQFVVNAVLSATITPASPSAVTGGSVSLTAVPSGGTSPYLYQWYTSAGCALGNLITGQKSQVYPTPAQTSTGTYSYSVHVTDSSVGVPAQSFCASTTVTVTLALLPTLALSPQGMDVGQTTNITATVTWVGGTPPYTVTLFSGSSATCTSDTSIVLVLSGSNPKTGLTSNSTTFPFSAPSSSAYYCVVMKDSATTPATVPTSTVHFTVNPSPSKVLLVISPTALESGQTTNVTATVTWVGGTQPYTVTLYSGSSATCTSDTIASVVVSGSNPKTGLTGKPTTTFLLQTPGSNTYYCATVTDDGVPPLTASSPTSMFSVNAVISVSAPVFSPTVLDLGQSKTVTATVTWSGGTSPYTVTLFGGPSGNCLSDETTVEVLGGSNPQTGLTGTTATFTFASPAASTYYCAAVMDSSAVPVTIYSVTSEFIVNPDLMASLAPVSPPAIDSGQSATLTASITWSGGTPPYSVALFSGLSSSCPLDTTAAGGQKTGLIVTSITITFASPTSTYYYCAKVTDSSGAPFTFTTSSVQFTVNTPLTVTISPPAPSIGAGQTAPTLKALPSQGTPPYGYQWYTGVSCVSATAVSGQTSSTYMTGALTTTSAYSVRVTDNSTGTPAASACASVTVTVGNGPEGVAGDPETGMVYVADPFSNQVSVIYSFSNAVIATIPVGSQPWGIAVDSADNIIYVTNSGSNTVSVINGGTDAVTRTIAVGTKPEGIAFNSALDEVYVADSGSNTVSVIDTMTGVVTATLSVGSAPQSVAVGPTPYTVFVTDYGFDTVSVITITLNPAPSFGFTTVTVGNNPWGVAVSQLTNEVYVTNSGSGTVSVLNGLTLATIATIPVGGTPQGIDIDGATSTAYVAGFATGTVSAINIATNTLITSAAPLIPIPAGSGPWGVAVLLNPGNVLYPNLGYVTNSLSNTVTIINLAPNKVLATVPAVPSAVSATILPTAPSIDSGQSITLTAVPSQGVSPTYQWYTGPSCGAQILGQTASTLTTGFLTSTTPYSVLVTDSATPATGICASATVTVNTAFTGTAVTISPSSMTIDSGQPVTLTVSWTGAGTSPYNVLLTTSSSASCASTTFAKGYYDIGGTSTTFTVIQPSTTNYCATVTDSAYSAESASTTSAAVITVGSALSTPTLVVSPSAIDYGQSATITATVTWSGGTPPYSVTLFYTGTNGACPSGATALSPETGVVGTSATFAPAALSSTTYYCARVTDSANVQVTAYSSAQLFTVNPRLKATVSPSAPAIDGGQSVILTATPTNGTSPYHYQWYTGSSCASVASGQASQSLSTGTLTSNSTYSVLVTDSSVGTPGASKCASVTVTVDPAPAAAIPVSPTIDSGQSVTLTVVPSRGTVPYFYQWYTGSSCASGGISGAQASVYQTVVLTSGATYSVLVTDSSVGTPGASKCAGVTVTVDPPPTVTISPAAPTIANGQSVTLTAVPSQGVPPYSYLWYSGSACASGSAISGQAASTYTASPTSTTTYSVKVTDSSPGLPSTSFCASATVTVSAFFSTLTISPSAIDAGQSATITATIAWTGGISPYSVTLYSGTSNTCSLDTAVVNSEASVVGTSATFFPAAPTSTAYTYFCASVIDSANVQVTVYSYPQLFTVNPKLTATVSPSAPAIDGGQSVILTAIPSSGTSPYHYQWYTGSSCSSAISDATSSTYTTAVLTSGATYSVLVTDSSVGTPGASKCAGVTVTVDPALAAAIPVSPTIDSGQTVTLTVVPSPGTPPYSYQWYAGSSCLGEISGATSATYAASPASTTAYSVNVTDSSTGTPRASVCVSAVVTVNHTLTALALTLSPSAIDAGQTATITSTVTWSGGTSLYSVTLRSGTSSTCSSDITVAGTATGVVGTSATLSTASLGSTTYYCATVTDSAASPVTATTSFSLFTVNSAPTVTVSPAAPAIDAGQSITLTAVPSQGTSPYSYQWYKGSSCAGSAISGAESPTYAPSPGSTTTYSVEVTDSSAGTPLATACHNVIVTVNPVLSVTISLPPPPIDSGQTVTLSAVPSPGTPPYSYQWYAGSSCGSAISGAESKNYSTGVLTSTSTYSVDVMDSSPGTPAASSCASVVVTVESALTAAILPASPSIDSGQTITLTAVPSEGTSPYFYQWYTGSACVGAAISGQTASTYAASPPSTTTQATVTYSVRVTDSSTASPPASFCASVTVTVNPALTAAILPASPTIDSGQTVTLTAEPSPGTSPYSYQWYTGSACAGAAISGQTTASYVTAALTSGATYSVLVTDSSVGTPNVPKCAPVTVTVNPALVAPTISVSPVAIDTGQSSILTTTASFSGGTSPYTCQWLEKAPGAGSYGSPGSSFSCTTSSLPSIPTGTLSTLGLWSFELQVTDAASASATSLPVTVTVNPSLTPPTISAIPGAVDTGQGSTLSTTVSFSGGTSPYTCQWLEKAPGAVSYSSPGSSFGCSAGSYPSAPTGALSTTGAWSFELQVTDSASVSVVSAPFTVTVNPALGVPTVAPSATAIDTGQSVTVMVSWNGGTAPYVITLYSSPTSSCSSGSTLLKTQGGQASSPYTFNGLPVLTANTWYCATVTDGSVAPETTTSPSSEVTVNPALAAPTISSNPEVMDTGQGSVLTTTASISGGTSPYTCQWLEEAPGAGSYSSPGSSFSCTTSSLPTIPTGTLSVIGVWSFELQVTDSASVTAASAPVTVTVNPALVAPTISASPGAIDTGQSSTLSTTVSFSGGTSPYACQWLEEAPGAGSYSSPGSSFGCDTSSLPSIPTGTLSTLGVWYFELQVTDSAGVSLVSNAASVTVNSQLTAPTVSALPGTVEQGQSSSLTSSALTTGTFPYAYQWVEEAPGASTFSPITGATSSSYTFATSASTAIGSWSFELQVTDATGASVTSGPATVGVSS